MKLLQIIQQYAFIIILLFPFSGAYSQVENSKEAGSICPSVITQIKKADPGMMKKFFSSSLETEKSKLPGNFRDKEKSNLLTEQSNSIAPMLNSIPIAIGTAALKKPVICPPLVQTNFEGNPLTPFYLPPVGYYASECKIAISNAGKIVSVSNGWINYYNENRTLVFSDSLYHLGNSLIDVHVMYDPKKDRFVFISQYGYANFVNVFQVLGVAVAFSKSNDPVNGWNFYFLPDAGFNDNSIGDYPQLGISNDEIFITDLRTNNGGNITHSSIVQIDKNAGYAGAPFINSHIYKVKLSSTTKGPIVPAPGGSTTYGPGMYFIMAYESGIATDKYFVFEITNTIASGQSVLKTYGPVRSNITYAAAGTSYQPGGIQLLDLNATDNTYMQNAFYENGLLQFCQNTNVNGKAGIILGRINGIPNNLSCTAKTLSDPNLYLQFPSIAYAGNSSSDNSAIVGLQHTAANTYPGLSAVYVNSNFDVSALTTVKAGADTINGVWGDYSGICRRYNHPGEVWFEGQYGSTTFPNINWIAKLQKPSACADAIVSNDQILNNIYHSLTVTPNPLLNSTTISFKLSQLQKVLIWVFDINGRLVKTLANAQMQPGTHQLTWDAKDEEGNNISAGIYFLRIETKDYAETKKLSVIK